MWYVVAMNCACEISKIYMQYISLPRKEFVKDIAQDRGWSLNNFAVDQNSYKTITKSVTGLIQHWKRNILLKIVGFSINLKHVHIDVYTMNKYDNHSYSIAKVLQNTYIMCVYKYYLVNCHHGIVLISCKCYHICIQMLYLHSFFFQHILDHTVCINMYMMLPISYLFYNTWSNLETHILITDKLSNQWCVVGWGRETI